MIFPWQFLDFGGVGTSESAFAMKKLLYLRKWYLTGGRNYICLIMIISDKMLGFAIGISELGRDFQFCPVEPTLAEISVSS